MTKFKVVLEDGQIINLFSELGLIIHSEPMIPWAITEENAKVLNFYKQQNAKLYLQ